jgi:hypothetical protein
MRISPDMNTGTPASIWRLWRRDSSFTSGSSQAVDRTATVERDLCLSVKASLLCIAEKNIEKISHTEYSQKRKNWGGLPNGARMNAKMGKLLFKELRRLGLGVEEDTRMKHVLNRPQLEDSEEANKNSDELDLGVDEEDVVRAWVEQDIHEPMP